MRLKRALILALAAAAALAACAREETKAAQQAATPAAPQVAAPAEPQPEGLHAVRPAPWRMDEIDIPVPANGGDLEFKLGMRQGDVVVYSIRYPGLEHPGLFVTEFHGHTEKNAEGIGDLMFYSKTGGAEEHGALKAPFDGVHGWYLKNDSDAAITVQLRLAGFYEVLGVN